jgi:predicted ester cyclase
MDDAITVSRNLAGMPNMDPIELARCAKAALERVCSGANLDPASRYYSAEFVDHVNDLEFSGLDGAEQSIALYKQALSNLQIRVHEQLVEGNRVTSRFTVSGSCRGRHVRFGGITISRFEVGLIVEDWSMIDTLSMARQLGLWRTLWLAVKQRRAIAIARAAARSGG